MRSSHGCCVPGIQDAVVVARENSEGDKQLVAYYISPDSNPGAETLRPYLLEKLPEYMVQAAYVRLESLPLTPNGKLDRMALPAPDMEAFTVRSYEPPVGEVETRLAEIWAEVLKLDRVGRYDNFFDLGGHSLLAITVLERLRRHGLNLEIRSLFLSPTLAALAATAAIPIAAVEVPANRIPPACEAIRPDMLPLIELSLGEIEKIVSKVPGGSANVQDIYPLAPLQEGILFHHLIDRDGDPYLLRILFSFDSRQTLDRYLASLQSVIDRHDILRTAVQWEDLPEPVQVVYRNAPLHAAEVVLDPTSGDIAEQLYARFTPRYVGMDVRQAPLLRVYFARDNENNRWLMLLLKHHLVGDHTSLEVMQAEVQACLLGQEARLPTALPFRNLVAQVRGGMRPEEHETFFRKMLGDVDESTAPFGLLDVRGDGGDIEEARLILEDSLARRIRERARSLGVSAASICHLAWAQVLAKPRDRRRWFLAPYCLVVCRAAKAPTE